MFCRLNLQYMFIYIIGLPGFPVIVLKQIHLCLRAKGLLDIVTAKNIQIFGLYSFVNVYIYKLAFL